jgi:hypothetical protein
MSKKMLSLDDIESTVALDLPDRELMSWVSICTLNGVEIENVTFNTEIEGNNFCNQWMSSQSGMGNSQCVVYNNEN